MYFFYFFAGVFFLFLSSVVYWLKKSDSVLRHETIPTLQNPEGTNLVLIFQREFAVYVKTVSVKSYWGRITCKSCAKTEMTNAYTSCRIMIILIQLVSYVYAYCTNTHLNTQTLAQLSRHLSFIDSLIATGKLVLYTPRKITYININIYIYACNI